MNAVSISLLDDSQSHVVEDEDVDECLPETDDVYIQMQNHKPVSDELVSMEHKDGI